MNAAEFLYGVPLDEEPWIVLPTEKDFDPWTEQDMIQYNQQLRNAQKYLFFKNAFDLICANNVEGDYLEFGCHRARSFRMALGEARRQNLRNMRFLAFDSFEGLPPSDGIHGISTYQSGDLATSEKQFLNIIAEQGILVDRVHTVKGFYQDSLTPELTAQLRDEKGVRAALINVDCDLYESATHVFNFIGPFLQEGTCLYIDDYFVGYRAGSRGGLPKAFNEFEDSCEFGFLPHSTVGWWGRAFIAYRK